MQILTLDNRTYTLEKIPEWVDEKLAICSVLDNSDPNGNPDFFYIPLIFLESFNAPGGSTGNWQLENQDAIGLEDADRRGRDNQRCMCYP
jgi:hypothetical protein